MFIVKLSVIFVLLLIGATALEETQVETAIKEDSTIGRMLEEGRTLAHHAVKRFMIILPAIFFKLGVAFTLLILVTIVAVNNGFIGFLLLVVGLSSVLARLQEARRPPVVPYISPLPPYHHHYIDRSDSDQPKHKDNPYQYLNQQYYNNGYVGSKV